MTASEELAANKQRIQDHPLVPAPVKESCINLITLIQQSPDVMQRVLDIADREDPRWQEIVVNTERALGVLRRITTLTFQIERGEGPDETTSREYQ